MSAVEYDVAVLGAGLVGTALGYGLARESLRVAMVDEADDAYRASRGNFGLVWVQGKGVGRPEYAAWSRLSSERWSAFAGELALDTGTDPDYRRPGGVQIALDEDELQDIESELARLRREAGNQGYDYEMLDAGALRRLVPQLGARVVGGSYCPHDGHANPLRLLRALHAAYRRLGGHLAGGARVDAVRTLPGGGFEVHAGAATIRAAKVVLAAGLGCRELGAMLGLDVPVEPNQGQLLVTERAPMQVEIPSILLRQTEEGSFMLGASHADVGTDRRTRARTLAEVARRCVEAYPFLEHLRVVRSWAALRVMTPDGFPIYHHSTEHPGLYVVTCHSGVTLAANHALETSRWIVADGIPASMACFSLDRFAGAA